MGAVPIERDAVSDFGGNRVDADMKPGLGHRREQLGMELRDRHRRERNLTDLPVAGGQLTLGELSQVISLAEVDPVVPENIVGRCHVK
jgi:hypothetical protein